jgi:hypothetical protein
VSDDLRDRLGELADEATPELSDAARRRVVETMRRDGPDFVRSARRRRRTAVGIGVATLAAAAAVTLALRPAPPPEPTAVACESWEAAEAREVGSRIDLGARGAVTVDGSVTVEAPDPCTTILHLDTGRIDVRADDLGGGLLRVAAGDVAVEVRGTRFSVTRSGGDVAVAVTEGHVVVAAPEEREIHLRDGERWSLGAELAMAEAAEGGRGDGLGLGDGDSSGSGSGNANESGNAIGSGRGNAIGSERGNANGSGRGTGNASAERASPTELLARAESLWRDGERAGARRIFRRVGGGEGAVAEAAWIRLARLELRSGQPGGALRALAQRERRFDAGRLGAEALFLEADAHGRLGQSEARERAVIELQRLHPDSPQARAVAHESAE